jgi:hypothetical protein
VRVESIFVAALLVSTDVSESLQGSRAIESDDCFYISGLNRLQVASLNVAAVNIARRVRLQLRLARSIFHKQTQSGHCPSTLNPLSTRLLKALQFPASLAGVMGRTTGSSGQPWALWN